MGGLSLRSLAEQMRVVAKRELDGLEPLLDVVHDRAEIASPHVGMDVDAPGSVLPLDDVGSRRDANVGDIAQANVAAVGRVDQQVADAGQAVARLGRRPDDHVVNLAFPVNVADFVAGEDHGGRATDIARLEPDATGVGEIDLDLDLRNVLLRLLVQIDETVDPGQRLLHLRRLLGADPSSSGPKMRTTIDSPAPVSTSLIRSLR